MMTTDPFKTSYYRNVSTKISSDQLDKGTIEGSTTEKKTIMYELVEIG